MSVVKILGDVHGNYEAMFNVITSDKQKVDYILQLGDLGFDYKILDVFKPMNRVELRRIFHFIPGNHDNYDKCFDRKECLGDYGPIYFIPKSFFLRGGFSLDYKYRTPGLDWWDKEELTLPELDNAVKMYEKIKPDYMFSHECPISLVDKITDGRIAIAYGFPPVIQTRTALALERMFKFHKPKIHFFAHYHRDVDMVVNGTRFICLTSDNNKFAKQTYFNLEIEE